MMQHRSPEIFEHFNRAPGADGVGHFQSKTDPIADDHDVDVLPDRPAHETIPYESPDDESFDAHRFGNVGQQGKDRVRQELFQKIGFGGEEVVFAAAKIRKVTLNES
jgi:hypothetical protein